MYIIYIYRYTFAACIYTVQYIEYVHTFFYTAQGTFLMLTKRAQGLCVCVLWDAIMCDRVCLAVALLPIDHCLRAGTENEALVWCYHEVFCYYGLLHHGSQSNLEDNSNGPSCLLAFGVRATITAGTWQSLAKQLVNAWGGMTHGINVFLDGQTLPFPTIKKTRSMVVFSMPCWFKWKFPHPRAGWFCTNSCLESITWSYFIQLPCGMKLGLAWDDHLWFLQLLDCKCWRIKHVKHWAGRAPDA